LKFESPTIQYICQLATLDSSSISQWNGKDGIIVTDLICDFIGPAESALPIDDTTPDANQVKVIKTVFDALKFQHSETFKELSQNVLIEKDKQELFVDATTMLSNLIMSDPMNIIGDPSNCPYSILSVQCYYENMIRCFHFSEIIGIWYITVQLKNISSNPLRNISLIASTQQKNISFNSSSAVCSMLSPHNSVTIACHLPISRDTLQNCTRIPIVVFLQHTKYNNSPNSNLSVLLTPNLTSNAPPSRSSFRNSPSLESIASFTLFAAPPTGQYYFKSLLNSTDSDVNLCEQSTNNNSGTNSLNSELSRILSNYDELFSIDLRTTKFTDQRNQLSQINYPNVVIDSKNLPIVDQCFSLKSGSPISLLAPLQYLSSNSTDISIYRSPVLITILQTLLEKMKTESMHTIEWLQRWLASAGKLSKLIQSHKSSNASAPSLHIQQNAISLTTEYYRQLPFWIELQSQTDKAAIPLFAEAEYLVFPHS
jgi:hypothetical protein